MNFKKKTTLRSAVSDRRENLNRHLIVKVVTFDLLTIFYLSSIATYWNNETRTHDPTINSRTLYQLSYIPLKCPLQTCRKEEVIHLTSFY